MDLHIKETFKEVLSRLIDKPVYIILKNGHSYSCKIKTVGQFCIHIERTDSKSYYDMIIRNDDISAVEMQVRG